MRFEWDENKRQSNLCKHGIDFEVVEKIFDDESITYLDDRFDYGEERLLTFGLLDGEVVVIVHTMTDDVFRVISIRRATRNEEKKYFDEVKD